MSRGKDKDVQQHQSALMGWGIKVAWIRPRIK
jgi:hypothetical protein